MTGQALAETPAGRKPRRTRAELEFLPAVQEILETPPSPTARYLAMALCAFAVIAIAWSWFGQVDTVAIGDGRVVPSGKVKVIQPLEPGVVRNIRVRDGQTVEAGEVLIELDPTETGANVERLAVEFGTLRTVAARLRAFLDHEQIDTALRAFAPPAFAGAEVVATQKRLLESQVLERQSRLRALADEAARRQAEREAIKAAIRRLERTLPLAQERSAARDTLASQGYGSRLTALEVQQQVVEMEGELAIQRQRLQESAAALAALESERQRVEAELRRTATAELADSEARAAIAEQELIKARQRLDLQVIRSPIAGTVQQLAVHTIGGVVTQAQALMAVVPADTSLEIEAFLPNKDVGFVRVGQAAEIKLETFPFTRYGTVPGWVTSISGDSIQHDKLGLVYAVYVELDRTQILVDGSMVDLAPGMRATIEVKTGKRRILEYVLSPLIRYRDESLRER